LYEVLEVQPDATATELRSSYLKLSLKHHPDKNPHDAEAAELRYVGRRWGGRVRPYPSPPIIHHQPGRCLAVN
jgi:hypothetical protein